MKKQFIIIACTLVAFTFNLIAAQAQVLTFFTATPYALKLSLPPAPTAADPVNTNPAEALDLTGKGLTEVPAEALTSTAEVITLDSNLLNELTVTTGQWTQCRQLFARHNWLVTFPSGASTMSNLELMDLTRNQIDKLPSSISELGGLKKLVLDLNYLDVLPDEIGQMRSLKELSIRRNALSQLPAQIGQLANLEVLSLTNNSLEALPDEIGQLTNLKVLRLDFNNLQRLPATLANLKDSLKILVLKGNPLGKQWTSEIKAMLPNTQIEF